MRAQYLQDWIVDPEFPLVWRLQAEKAGSGRAGRHRRAHRRHGPVRHRRPADRGQRAHRDVRQGAAVARGGQRAVRPSGGTERGPVTVDDAALFLGRFGGGALASFEATRFATGRKNAIRLEVNGSAGSLAFDFESMNELSFYDGAEDPQTAGFRRILVTEPTHPYVGRLVAAGAPARATSTRSPTRWST